MVTTHPQEEGPEDIGHAGTNQQLASTTMNLTATRLSKDSLGFKEMKISSCILIFVLVASSMMNKCFPDFVS
jgi:hypothetical protein